MKPAIKMAGIFRPTAATMRPMLAVSVYPGATDEMPSTAPGEGAGLACRESLGKQSGGLLGDLEFVVCCGFGHGRSSALS